MFTLEYSLAASFGNFAHASATSHLTRYCAFCQTPVQDTASAMGGVHLPLGKSGN